MDNMYRQKVKADRIINFWVSDDDHAKIKEASHIKRTSISDYIRATMLHLSDQIINQDDHK